MLDSYSLRGFRGKSPHTCYGMGVAFVALFLHPSVRGSLRILFLRRLELFRKTGKRGIVLFWAKRGLLEV